MKKQTSTKGQGMEKRKTKKWKETREKEEKKGVRKNEREKKKISFEINECHKVTEIGSLIQFGMTNDEDI